jgi:splicing factor 3B subunit 3
LAHYYLGETATSISKSSLITGGPELLIISTVNGGLYAVLPLDSKDDITFYQHLEMFMRQEHANHLARDHLSFRSYFAPVKNVVDGTF